MVAPGAGTAQSTSRAVQRRVARWRPAAAPEVPADAGDRHGQHGGEGHREEAVGDPLCRAEGQRRLGRTGGPVEHDPAYQRAHQVRQHRDGEDHPAGPGPHGQRRDHRPGLHEEPEQETGRAPGHHGGDGADGRAGDDDADPEAALQRTPPARARRPPGVPPPAALARPARVPGRTLPALPRSATRARSLPRPGRLSLPGLGGHPPGRRSVTHAALAAARSARPARAAPAGASAVQAGVTPSRTRVPRIGHATASLTPGRPGARRGRSRRSAAPARGNGPATSSRGNGPATSSRGTVPPRPPAAGLRSAGAAGAGGTVPPRPPGAAGGGPGTRPRGLAPGSPPYGLLGRVSRRGGSLICASDVSRCGLITGT